LLFFDKNSSRYLKKWGRQFITTLPVIKPYLRKIHLATFTRNLAMTLTAGISITEALLLASQAVDDLEFTTVIIHLRHKISSGLQLHASMTSFAYFPSFVVQMIKVGEESGSLALMLNKVADFLESETEQLLNQVGQLLEPLIILILGVLIGGLVIGLYLPIFKLGNVL
jgi:type IV pilus assembly protein PilC